MRGLGAVALKCIGVLVMVGSLRLIIPGVALLTGGEGGPPAAITVAVWTVVLAQLLVGLWLVLRGGRLARRWFDDEPVAAAPAPRIVLRLALVILGVVFVALAVADLCGAASSGVLTMWSDYEGSLVAWDWPSALVAAIYPIAQLVVGVLLIVFATTLSRRLWREVSSPFADLSPPAGAAPPLTTTAREEASPAADVPRA